MNVQVLIKAINQQWKEKLDKIRGEIADLVDDDPEEDYQYGYNYALMKAAQIIDKYRKVKAISDKEAQTIIGADKEE